MKTRHVVIQAYLHTLAFALLIIGGLSLFGYASTAQPSRFSLVLLPDGALAVLFIGLILLAVSRGWRRLGWLSAGLLLSLTLYSLGHNWLAGGADQGLSRISGFLRMRSGLALVLSLLTLALLASDRGRLGRLFSRTLGLACAVLAVSLQLANHWPSLAITALGFKPESSSIAHLLTLLLGGAAVLLSLLSDRRGTLPQRRDLLAGLLGTLLACLGWYLLAQQNIAATHHQSEVQLSKVQLSIERSLQARLALLQRIAERWRARGQIPSTTLWSQEAAGYLRDFPNIDLLAVLDAQLRLQGLHSRDPVAETWLQEVLDQPGPRTWLENARLHSGPQMNDARLQPPGHALLATPLELPDRPAQLLIASLDLSTILESQLGAEFGGFILKVFNDEQLIFDSQPERPGSFLTPVGQQRMQLVPGSTWRLVSYLDRPLALNGTHLLPTLILLIGLSLSCLLMTSQRLAGLAIEHARGLHRLNRELETSMARQQSLQALNERIMQYSMDLLCCIDEQGRFIQLSASSASVLGYAPHELLGQRHYDLALEPDRARTQAEIQAIIEGGSNHALRNRYRRKDGSTVHLLWSAAWSVADRTLFAVAHDITRLVQHEAYAEDQRDILSMISTDQPLADSLKAICQMVESLDVTARCSVLLVDKAQRQLHLGAAPSLPLAYQQAIDGMAVGPQACSCGTAVFNRQLVLVDDIGSDPLWYDLRELALRHELRACWSIPLIAHHGAVLGTFAIYQRQVLEPNDEQLQLLGTAGQLAAIAIEHQHDRHRLQESEQRYRSLFTFNPDPVFSLDREGRFLSLNQAGCDLSGYREEQVVGQDFALLVRDEDQPRVAAHFQAALAGQAQRYELRARQHQGERIELAITYLPIMVEEQRVGVFGIAKDIGERNRMTRALRETLEHSQHRGELLKGLSDSALRLNNRLDAPAQLEQMVEQLRLLIGTHLAVIRLFQDVSGAPAIEAQSHSDQHAAWSPEQHLGAPVDPPGGLAVPLWAASGRQLGLLQLSDKCQGAFDEDDLAIAQQFAQLVVTALENNRLMRAVLAGERRLQAQLDFTSAITDSIGEGLIATDLQGRLSFINPVAARLLGQAQAALLQQPLDALLPLPLAEWQLTEQEPRHGEFSLTRTDGSPYCLAYTGTPLLDDSGPNGWAVALRDISLQRLASQVTRERDQFFTLSLEMFCMIDLRGQFIQVNPAFISVLGYPSLCLIGHSYLPLIDEQDRPLFKSALLRLQQGEQIQDLESRVLDVRGQQHWLQLSAALGEDQVIYCVARDISARKAAEQLLQHTLEELERSNHELQQFAFVASHDLQEPLRKIQAFAERLEAGLGELAPQNRDYLQRMSSAAGRMQSLIHDLLLYSRITSRAQPFVLLDLSQILGEVLQDLEASLETSQAQVDCGPLPALL
ncbi:MAG TPA: PAS domain S-box protein, partial [Pseudomonas sp.]|nr:PAS domain S-box protein [Pseudomonas sp.]